jgi:hypothetical protein
MNNFQRVREALKDGRSLSYSSLVEQAGLAPGSASRVLSSMRADNHLVVEDGRYRLPSAKNDASDRENDRSNHENDHTTSPLDDIGKEEPILEESTDGLVAFSITEGGMVDHGRLQKMKGY